VQFVACRALSLDDPAPDRSRRRRLLLSDRRDDEAEARVVLDAARPAPRVAVFLGEELRSAKAAHAFLTEEVRGPESFGECLRSFRFFLFFGISCVAQNEHPPLTRCWKELEQLFMQDPTFDDGVFVQSWVLMDFPFGPKGETALDYFEQFLDGIDGAPAFLPFVEAARTSRLGLHQDVMRTKNVARFRELRSGKVTEAFPSIEEYGKCPWPS
jgi:hypothetical protein